MSDNLIETLNEIEVPNTTDSTESSFSIVNGQGVEVTEENGNYTISSNSSGTLVEDLGDLSAGDTIQNALESLLEKISDSAGIQSGMIIRTTAEGIDVDFPDVKDLLENTMYLRLVLNNGRALHISAFEIDRALDTVARLNSDKADQSAVDELAAALEGKASVVQLESFESDIATKADKTTVNLLSATVAKKADKTDVEAIAETVASKANADIVTGISESLVTKADKTDVEAIAETVASKANADTVTKLQNDVQTLQNTLNSLSDSAAIAAIQNQINNLNSEIRRRLTIDDLRPLETTTSNLSNAIEENSERITALETSIVNKASVAYVQRNVNELNSVIANVSAKVDNKADKASVASKASQEDFNLLSKRMNNLNSSTKETVDSLTNAYSQLQEDVNKKLTKNKLENETLYSKISASINKKVDKEEFDDSIDDLNEKIDAIDFNTPIKNVANTIHSMQTTINNELSTVNSYVNSHERKLLLHEQKLAEMRALDNKLEIAASNEWVRVMTPEEYDRLPSSPNYPDGTKNPYAKQPNVLYMLVKYNKPVALYIGTILIAKAQENGSVSFVYEFPIIF